MSTASSPSKVERRRTYFLLVGVLGAWFSLSPTYAKLESKLSQAFSHVLSYLSHIYILRFTLLLLHHLQAFHGSLRWPHPTYLKRRWCRLTYVLPTASPNDLQVFARRGSSSPTLSGKIMVLAL